MSNLYDTIIKQQELHPNAEVLEIYSLIDSNKELRYGGSFDTVAWTTLTKVHFQGFPSKYRWYTPSKLWYVLKDHFNQDKTLLAVEQYKKDSR